MGILETIWYMLVILPIFMIQEGIDMFQKAVAGRDWFDVALYILLVVFVLLLVILLGLGYR